MDIPDLTAPNIMFAVSLWLILCQLFNVIHFRVRSSKACQMKFPNNKQNFAKYPENILIALNKPKARTHLNFGRVLEV